MQRQASSLPYFLYSHAFCFSITSIYSIDPRIGEEAHFESASTLINAKSG
jgi:hypothetical protein